MLGWNDAERQGRFYSAWEHARRHMPQGWATEDEQGPGGHHGHHFFHRMPLRGMLPVAVLGLIKDKPTYGGEIYQSLKDKFEIDVPRPVIYVLLRRLEHAGMMVSKWETAESGPAKRRYTITEDGLEFYNLSLERLKKMRKIIDTLAGEKS